MVNHAWAALTLTGAVALYVAVTASARVVDRGGILGPTTTTSLDILVITAIVWFTGGVESEYYLLYYLPVVHAALRLNPRDAIGACVLSVALFVCLAITASHPAGATTTALLRSLGMCLSASVLLVFLTLLKRESEVCRSLKGALHDSLARVAAVYDVSHVANTGADLKSVLSVLLDHAARGTGAEAGAAAALRANGELDTLAVLSPTEELRRLGAVTPPDCTSEPARRAIDTGAPVVVSFQVATDAATPLDVDTIYLPLTTPAGSIGVLGLTSRPARRFTRHHKEFLKSLAAEAAIAVENAQLRSELRNMAVTDYLTGLPNRREVERVLAAECERAASQGRSAAVLMMDVDDLKALNDRYGHAVGDEALCALARVLKRTLGPKDTAGRVGGDEFLVVLPGATAAQGEHVAGLLIQEYNHELAKADLPIDAGALVALSAGVAASDGALGIGDEGVSGANLVSLADAALYQAKRSGKRQVRVGSLAGVAAG